MAEEKLVVLKVFGKEYKISRQARMVFFAYMASFLSAVLVALIAGKGTWISSIVTLLILSIVWVLGTYATNCMVVGQCNTYAWVIVAFSIANAVTYGLGALFVLYVKLSSGGMRASKPMSRSSRK